MTDDLAPENLALKEASDFYVKLTRGAKTLAQVKEADVDVGATPKTPIHAQDKITLHHYDPLDGVKAKTGPVLIVYGLIGRYTMADLQEDRSLVRNLLARGVDLYVVDWGHPTRADQNLTLDDYVDWYLDDCVDAICAHAGVDAVTLLGICEGGVFSTLYAAQHPEKVKNLILTITPIDFHGDEEDADETHGFINLWTRNLEDEDIRLLIDAFGNLPGEIMASVFQMMTPVRTLTKYNLDLIEAASDEKRLLNFLRMEKWLADRPHHPGAAALQWLIELYKENRLIKGTFEMSGQTIDLENITMPVLNVYALQDHIIPPPCSKALEKYVGTPDYTEIALPGGHVGVYVSGKSQGIVGDGVFDWLMERQ
ncbi:class III poly(R)-hydroxyalkanoic acid synthase subunit PhaC [Ruegeria atlantica]|uniref:class III poly(R)-hydroxyalkanoic acid synthase subunit PhaC n=1 Tax=Ruegeria atlantica TaxID=81569 RepID=UPI0014813171|nr:class III poly(R)-hydroxyalkanoic acid synthase subunit PhaC [Ruegeria atlantica]